MSDLTLQDLDYSRALPVLAALLAGVCLLMLVRLALLLADGPEVSFEPLPVEPAPSVAASTGPVDWALFGDAVEPDYGLNTPLPATPLTLRLRGVVTGARGYAIIVDERGDEGVYRVDDEIPGDARLVAIEPRRVVLERNGTREALELPGGAISRDAPTRSAPSDAPANAYPAAAGIGSLASITSQFRLDPDELAHRITILPVAGGGFRVRAGRDAAIFTQLGFELNDVVLAINGQRVDNQGDVRAVFENWNPSEPLAITVRRGDRQIVLTPGL